MLVVSRPLGDHQRESDGVYGFRAIKPALDLHPTFLESLVQRLSAADHMLCANSLQLVNALMRDAIANGGQHEWPKFIKRLQDLGVIGGVGMLMRGDAASDGGSPLAAAILEFQGLTKILLKKWKEVSLNIELAEHKRALKTIHLLSKPPAYKLETNSDSTDHRAFKKHHPEKWRRLGFETESPAWEFDETGYLGCMDLVDYVRRNENAFQKHLMEQEVLPKDYRCPFARASLSITLILYEHFDIDQGAEEGYQRSSAYDRANGDMNVDRVFKPLLLQWARLHGAGLNAFFRLWKAGGTHVDDFYKIEEIMRIVVEHVVGSANRKQNVERVEEHMRTVTLETARQWQSEGLDEVYAEAWGPHLGQVKEQLHHEALQFMKEQRIRCLLQGSWFKTPSPGLSGGDKDALASWRFVRLSHNRRYLHYANYSAKGDSDVLLAELSEKIDLNIVTSVVSNVSATEPAMPNNDSTTTLKEDNTNTKITVYGTPGQKHKSKSSTPSAENDEVVLLELFPSTRDLASEWLDGLLMLLNQQPITKDTSRLVDLIEEWSLKIRMLNLRWEDVDWDALEQGVDPAKGIDREVPSRDGLDDEFWYDMGEA